MVGQRLGMLFAACGLLRRLSTVGLTGEPCACCFASTHADVGGSRDNTNVCPPEKERKGRNVSWLKESGGDKEELGEVGNEAMLVES